MSRYLLRSAKYLVQLVLLLTVLFTVMLLTGTAAGDSPAEMLFSTKGALMAALLLAVAAAYPSYGFTSRRVAADFTADREKIVRAMDMGGYVPGETKDGVMAFHTRNALKRLWRMGEDTLTVTPVDGGVMITGLRKEVINAYYRLGATI